MGKEKPGFLTPKAIANRIKSKGLQKLRWYCQMCQKQCRDENGFKCHTTSESHQRQLLLFGENAAKFMDGFSSEFSSGYVNVLKRRFGTKRVHANIVYQEYINDRNHIHMNSTRWLTLTDYVQWLGRKGIAIVDETEKGWFVTYIDRDPETLRRQEEIEKKKKLDLDDRQRQQMFLEKQMERNKDADVKTTTATELIKDENEKIKINFLKKKPLLKSTGEHSYQTEENLQSIKEEEEEEEKEEEEEDDDENEDNNEGDNENESLKVNSDEKKEKEFEKSFPGIKLKEEKDSDEAKKIENKPKTSNSLASSASSQVKATSSSSEKRKHSAIDDIIEMDIKKKEKLNRKDYWLHKNIVVKIVTKKLGEKYFKKKAIVLDVEDKYVGKIKLIESGATIKIDQADLETVLPAIGKPVLVLNGAYRGEQAILEQINEKEFNAKIVLSSGPLKGRIVSGIQYEDISKINQD